MQTTKTVWVNGCFDVLHRGHIELLEYAKSLGDKLVVGIDYDARVRAAKGPSRPFNTFDDRKYILESLKPVDAVVGFGTDIELENCIRKEKPSFLIVGSDWKNKTVIGEQYADQTLYFDRIGDYSTTKILESK
tara:strand:+ start:1874 stop:2272 length:399 start_codon:yes stop_codon:yes gene_type:complete